MGIIKVILGVIFAPIVALAAIDMARDMNGSKRKRKRRR